MATTSAEPLFLDTNVLIDATDELRPRHDIAIALLERSKGLVASAQVFREYLVVATRPTDVNGLGLSLEDALENISELRRLVRLVPEEKPLFPVLLRLVRQKRVHGKAIHDALIVATMQVHRVKSLVTSNPDHFARFSELIRVIPLGQ